VLSRAGILRRTTEALQAAAAIGRQPVIDAHTHPLFGAFNFEYAKT
jgi:hypothetical protein